VGDDDAIADCPQSIVERAVADRGLEADLYHAIERSDPLDNVSPTATDRLGPNHAAAVVKDARRGERLVNIQSDRQHEQPPSNGDAPSIHSSRFVA